MAELRPQGPFSLALTARFLNPPFRLGDARIFATGRLQLWSGWSTLSDEDRAELQRTLEKKAGRKVEMVLTTDPTLIGGFVAKIGSEVYDASVLGKIDKFRESLG